MGFFDFLKGKGEPAPAPAPAELKLGAVCAGTVVPMGEIADAVFSQGIMGQCCGVEPSEGKVYAPVDGKVTQLTDTLHAVCMEAYGMELLIHAGLDTVEMNGDGFTNPVKVGQSVKKGDLLLTMDLDKVRAAGHGVTVVMAVTNSDDFAGVEMIGTGAVNAGDDLLKINK